MDHLERLVARAHSAVYQAEPQRTTLTSFLTREYWRLIAGRPVLIAIATVLLLAPAMLAGIWAVNDPGKAGGLVPEEYQAVTQPRTDDQNLDLSLEAEIGFSTAIFTNNVRVSFLAFAGGILLGLGTAVVLVYNGTFFGAIAGLAIGAGNGGPFFELVSAHGVLELSCIIVTAAAGLRIGWALIEPGRRKRVDALVAEGKDAVAIVLGTIPWLVLAGLVEGFITPRGIGLLPAVSFGWALAGIFWGLVAWRGTAAVTSEP